MKMQSKNIGQIAEVIAGQSPPSDSYNEIAEGLPFYQGKTDFGDINPIPRKWCTNPKKIAEVNDILMSVRAPVGPVNIADEKACIGRGLGAIRAKDQNDFRYIYFFLKNNQELISQYSTGSTFKSISKRDIEKIKINIPKDPLDQKHIAQVLTDCEELIAKRKESISLLDVLLKSTFLELFGDPASNPKKFKLENLKTFYLSDKEGTKCGPFGSALKKNEYTKSGIPVWNMDNISKKGRFKFPINLFIDEKKFGSLNNYSTRENDIIISRAGTVGKMCLLDDSLPTGIISTNLIRLRLNQQKLLPVFFVSLMTHFKSRLRRLKTGADSGFTHMSTKILDSLKFPYPPVGLQKEFARIVEKVEETKKVYRNHLSELENLYSRLSQDVFKGELVLSKVVLREEFLGLDSSEPIDIIENKPTIKFTKGDAKKIKDKISKRSKKKDVTDLTLVEFLGIPDEIISTRENIEIDFMGMREFYQFFLKDGYGKRSFTSENISEDFYAQFKYRDVDYDYETWKSVLFDFLSATPPLIKQFFDESDGRIKLKLTDEAFKA